MRKTVQIGEKLQKEFPGLEISEKKVSLLKQHLDLLTKWNSKINLTAIRNPEEMLIKLYFDSLVVLDGSRISDGRKYLSGKILDLGSGAGIPGIILSMFDSSFQVTSVDKSGKKTSFQQHLVQTLHLSNVVVKNSRLEDLEIRPDFRFAYDTIISRAFDQIKKILYFADQFLKSNGYVVMWKGKKWKEELAGVDKDFLPKYQLLKAQEYGFHDSDHGGTILVFQKLKMEE